MCSHSYRWQKESRRCFRFSRQVIIFPPSYNISPAINGTFLTFREVKSLPKAVIRDSSSHPDSMNQLSKKHRQSILSTLRTVEAYSPVSIVVWWRPPWEEWARLCSSLCLCLNKNWKPVSSFEAICSGFLIPVGLARLFFSLILTDKHAPF